MGRLLRIRIQSADFLGLSGILVLNLLLFSDVLFQPQRVLSTEQGDLFLHFLSWRSYGFSQLQSGHLVLWNPHYLCGNPFFGNFESALLYPPNWIHFWLPLAEAVNWILVFHIIAAGSFTYSWARFRGLSPRGAFASGAIFMWSGAFYLHLSAGHLPNLSAMAWIPLIFLGLEGILERAQLGWASLLTLALSMQILAGHPQYVFFTLGVAILFFLLRMIHTSQRGLKAVLVLGSILLAVGISAVQFFTGYAAEQEGLRGLSIDYKMASSFSLPIENLWTLVFPEFFGKLVPGLYWGRWYPWEVSLYVGATAIVLAVIGWTRRGNPRLKVDLVLSLAVLILALGPATPLFGILYRWLPHANEIRGWGKLSVFLVLIIAMSAGAGLDALINEVRPWRVWIRPLGLVSLALLFLGLGLLGVLRLFPGIWVDFFSQISWLNKTMNGLDPIVRVTFGRDSGIHLAANLLVGSVLFALIGTLFSLENSWRNNGVLLLCVIELFVFARMNRPTFPMTDWEQKMAALKEFNATHSGEDRIYGTSSDSLVGGGDDIWEYEPLVLRRYGQFVASSQGLNDNRLFSVMPVFTRFAPIFGLVRLRYLLVENAKGIQFQELSFPRVARFQLFNQWDVLPDPATARKALFEPHFDYAHKVLLENIPSFPGNGGAKNAALAWNEIDSEHIEIRAEISKPAVLLVSDNYSRGWHALPLDKDGPRSYELIPGDYFLQAVPLGAGKHHFLLEYKPAAYSVGWVVTLISVFLYLAILCWLGQRRENFRMGIQ